MKKALEHPKRIVERKRPVPPRLRLLRKTARVPGGARPYLERMELDAPENLKQRFLQRVLVYALASVDAI